MPHNTGSLGKDKRFSKSSIGFVDIKPKLHQSPENYSENAPAVFSNGTIRFEGNST